MGKQYNKVQKRRRRLSYNERQKVAAKVARKPSRAKAKPAAPKKPEAPAPAATAA